MSPKSPQPPKPLHFELAPLQETLQAITDFSAEHFLDHTDGGYFERLDEQGRAQSLLPKRLLVQCRQLYCFSHRSLNGANTLEAAQHGIRFLENYWDNDGWIFSVEPDGTPHDKTRDLYAHAFVIFALSYYRSACPSDKRPQPWIDRTYAVLHDKMRNSQQGGFVEALDSHSKLISRDCRRQNPHMHLLEAFLADYASQPSARAKNFAGEILRLFEAHFFDANSGELREFFTHDWQPDPERGDTLEAGHHFEWCWILHEYHRLLGEPKALDYADRLCNWGIEHGFDQNYGGIYDAIKAGTSNSCPERIIDSNKRIWPLLECLKATAVSFDRALELGDREGKLVEQLNQQLAHLQRHYLLPGGRWIEHLDRKQQCIQDQLPGSTGYHLTLCFSELIRIAAKYS